MNSLVGTCKYRLTVLKENYDTKKVFVKCSCGRKLWQYRCNFLATNHYSCGCFQREWSSKNLKRRNLQYKHGYAVHDPSQKPEYRTWLAMKTRCNNSKSINYQYYGGRGITICKRWQQSFELFLKDMGKKPSKLHSLDRINNDRNYEPSNCRWATPKTQMNNRRKLT